MTALHTSGLGKRYRRRWALSDCTLQIPEGRVAGLVGPNGAGKTTLLQLAVGLLAPTTGAITVLGGEPGSDSIPRSGPGSCPGDSAPSSPSPWLSPSGPGCSSSTSRWPASTRWPAASSCRT
jgi:ABC-type multidrug transport system ATPase subunit